MTIAMRAWDAAPDDHSSGATGEPPSAHPRSIRIAGACKSYAVEARYQNLRLTDLCRAAGASERRVRHAFNECYGMSPMAFLQKHLS